MTGYVPMTREELQRYEAGAFGRDYTLSCDGYGDMDAARVTGWRVQANWGHDGWDLGGWPYVAVYLRESNDGRMDGDGRLLRVWELLQIVEGDHTVWSFPDEATRERAVDYLFLWYAAARPWAPLTEKDRERLDRGELAVEDKWRGPCRV